LRVVTTSPKLQRGAILPLDIETKSCFGSKGELIERRCVFQASHLLPPVIAM
jgi:hypothetical protein